MSITKTATLQPAKIFSFAFPVYFFIHCTVVYIFFLAFLSFFFKGDLNIDGVLEQVSSQQSRPEGKI